MNLLCVNAQDVFQNYLFSLYDIIISAKEVNPIPFTQVN